jgi:hypothetical protein
MKSVNAPAYYLLRKAPSVSERPHISLGREAYRNPDGTKF